MKDKMAIYDVMINPKEGDCLKTVETYYNLRSAIGKYIEIDLSKQFHRVCVCKRIPLKNGNWWFRTPIFFGFWKWLFSRI